MSDSNASHTPRPTSDRSAWPWTEPFVVDPDGDTVHETPACPEIDTQTDRQRELTRVTWTGVRKRRLWPCETCFPSGDRAPVIVTTDNSERSCYHTRHCHLLDRATTVRWIPRRQAGERIGVEECQRCATPPGEAVETTGAARERDCPRCGMTVRLLPAHIHGPQCNPDADDGGDTA